MTTLDLKPFSSYGSLHIQRMNYIVLSAVTTSWAITIAQGVYIYKLYS